MNEFLNFIKDICMINQNDTSCIGLSKLNVNQDDTSFQAPIVQKKGEVKLSDLMRKNNYN